MNSSSQRLVAAALAALGVASAIPIPLAGLDFAGVINIFGIDAGDVPTGLLTLVTAGSVLTIGVLILAAVATVLAATGSSAARPLLIVTAAAGIVTAPAAWLPTGVLLGTAAYLVGQQTPHRV
ncbi:hypothetical protein OG474_22760 [Kribbella sp. NBC_01505]|uniref:hypothetical protein n=1 Tax=Kribbella sp. NBC_01505 TaxID=2903580 RepID=UPI00386DF8FF